MARKVKSMDRWTKNEIAILKRNRKTPVAEVAKLLNRTEIAVNSMRYAIQGRSLKRSGMPWTATEIRKMAKRIDTPNSKMVDVMQRSPKELNRMRHAIRHGKVTVA